MEHKREYNYDLLRIISAVAVIMIHVSGTWFDGAIEDISENGLLIGNIQSPVFICVYNSISRFAVPCFLMLSGAFILDNEQNLNYKKFYEKSFAKVGVPLVAFSLIYIIYRIPLCFVGEKNGIMPLLKDILKGSPMYHMWYLYMLIGVYAMVPVVMRFKSSISDNTFYKFTFVFLILASISRWTTGKVRLQWDLGQAFEYLGYFMVGYTIRKMNQNHKNRIRAITMIVLGIVFELCAAGLEYKQLIAGIAENELKYRIVSPYCPLIVPASILIFYGFTMLNITVNLKKISGITFFIYLIHAGAWDVMVKAFHLLKGKEFLTGLDGAIWIPLFTVVIFIISCILSRLYLWLWSMIDKNKRVTKYLAHIIHLQTE